MTKCWRLFDEKRGSEEVYAKSVSIDCGTLAFYDVPSYPLRVVAPGFWSSVEDQKWADGEDT